MLTTVGCYSGHNIQRNFSFTYYENYDYCNVYFHDLPVIPSGCDSAKWNEKIIVTKSNEWRCDSKQECFYIIDMKIYENDPRQDLSDGIKGPFTLVEFLKVDPLKNEQFKAAD